jgi:hypothetical protein
MGQGIRVSVQRVVRPKTPVPSTFFWRWPLLLAEARHSNLYWQCAQIC